MKNQNVIEGLFTYRLHVLKKQTDRTMNEAFTDEIALTLTEARVLLSVGSFGALSVSDLGKASNLDRSQASRATDILERKGLVEKTSSTTDGRGVVVTLTAKGKKTYTRAAAIAKARRWWRCTSFLNAALSPFCALSMRTRSCSASSSRLLRLDAESCGLFTPVAARSELCESTAIAGSDGIDPPFAEGIAAPRAEDTITPQCTSAPTA